MNKRSITAVNAAIAAALVVIVIVLVVVRTPTNDSIGANAATSVERIELASALPRLVSGRDAAGRLDPAFVGLATSARLTSALSAAAIDARRVEIAAVVVSAEVDTILDTLDDGLDQSIRKDRAQWIYVDARFRVDEWQSIDVTGNLADLVVRGHWTWTMADGTTKTDDVEQFAFELERAPGSTYGWLLASERGFRTETR